jgi:hypothetical protein
MRLWIASIVLWLPLIFGLLSNNINMKGHSRVTSTITRKAFPETESGLATSVNPFRRAYSFLVNDNDKNLEFPFYTQVISDVDDTLKSSGGVQVAGVALGGIDVQYERGELYPGVAEFMLELSRRRGDGSLTSTPPKVAILTARAEELKLALELKGTSKLGMAFRDAGESRDISDWGLGPVLYGSVAEWIVQNRKGLRKFSNFERLVQQDPTGSILKYIYVGDTGELDQQAGEAMLREYPQLVLAVFLHVVSDMPNPIVPPPKMIHGRPVIFFRTYVGAAVKATQLGLIDYDGLKRVMMVAQRKLSTVPKTSEKWLDLNRDLIAGYRTLKLDPFVK